MGFLNRNHWGAGFLFGVVVPFVGYALLMVLNEQILEMGNFGAGGSDPIFDQTSLFLFAMCLNLIPFTIFQRRRWSQSMRGVLTATMIGAILWLILFSSNIF